MTTNSQTAEERPRNWIPPSILSAVGAIDIIVAVLTKTVDAIDRLGTWFLLALSVLSAGCCVYVLLSRQESRIVVNQPIKIPKFDRKTRIVAWIVLLIAVLVLVFSCSQIFFARGARVDSAPLAIDDTPTKPGGYPSADSIRDLPTQDLVSQRPKVSADSVNFAYRNATGVDLELILFDCYHYYFPPKSPLSSALAWRTWDFPPTEGFITCSSFRRGTGWYVFYVRRKDTRELYELATKNIFYSEWPTLTITANDDKDAPFKAVFKTQE